jgi:hypothetical protein
LNNIFEQSLVLEKYVRVILNTYFNNVHPTGIGYNFRCNVCGDSKHNRKKKRGWILKNKSPWLYYCHNCNASMPVTKWIKSYFPDIHRDFIKEVMLMNSHQISSPTINSLLKIKVDLPKTPVKTYESVKTKEIVPILKYNTEIARKAIKLCQSRNINEEIWKRWYVGVDGTYKNRLIIPFYDTDDNIYYFQARTLINAENKYTNMIENRENAIYNFFIVDPTKPVIVFEGIIDSLFVNNSIALLGTNWPEEVQKKIDSQFNDLYFLLDNDEPGRNKSKVLLMKGYKVFMWKRFIQEYNLPTREKWDVNDICLYLKKDKFTFEELKKYFTNSIIMGAMI